MGMKARPKRIRQNDALRKREMKLITELQKNHGYVLGEMNRKSERYTSIITFSTGHMQSGRAVRFVAPEGSALYKAFVEKDNTDEAKRKSRKKAAK